MFDILKPADLRQGELAKLVGVSRVTINNWIKGRTKPTKMVSDKLHTVLEQLKLAVDAGRLPVSKALRDDNRLEAIAAALQPIDR